MERVEITQRIVVLPAGTSTVIAAARPRGYLAWMVVGSNPMTVAPGTGAVTAGQGMNFDPGSSTENQGGLFVVELKDASNAFAAVSTGGTTVCVWEG